MQKNLIVLGAPNSLSQIEKSFAGYRFHFCEDPVSFQRELMRIGDKVAVLEVDICSLRHVEGVLQLSNSCVGSLKFIFIARESERSALQKYGRHPQMLFLTSVDRAKFPFLVTKFLSSGNVFPRSAQRQLLATPMIIQALNWTSSVPALQRRGHFIDFAPQGAQLYLPQSSFKVKEFVSVIYQNQNHSWVTVESQLRWERLLADGGQCLGVQFLAIA